LNRTVLGALALLLASVAYLVTSEPAPRPSPERELRASGAKEISIVAAPTKVSLIDGRTLDVWAYNGTVPGPMLRLALGETVRVKLTNHLPQPTTVHWHGIRLPNGMDGVPGVTQPPIAPGESFIYEFAPKDPGTFWFHPHLRSSEQVERGLFGVLIVEEPSPPPYTREEIWVLDDWLLADDGQIDPRFNTRRDLAHDGRWGQAITVNGKSSARLVVKAGERIRLRMLDVANGRVFSPDFGPLEARIIAFDGLYAERPLDPRGLEIAPGNRVDLDLTVPKSLAGQRVEIYDRFYARRPNLLAEVVVLDESIETPTFPSPAKAEPLVWSEAKSTEPRYVFRLNARAGGPFGIEWTINDRASRHEDHSAHDAPYDLPLGQWAKLRFVNDSFRLHPMHIHGQFFQVLARDGREVDEGHQRDTVLVHAKETVDVAILPRDRGKWMLHCHVLEHAESGMMTLVDVGEPPRAAP
jgi:FtsP/CotA-like multicopper oxidase with cupredoxin domain